MYIYIHIYNFYNKSRVLIHVSCQIDMKSNQFQIDLSGLISKKILKTELIYF